MDLTSSFPTLDFDTSGIGTTFEPSYTPAYTTTPTYTTSLPVTNTEIVTTTTGSNPTTFNIFKVIIIVILVILIGVTIALTLVFRNNTKTAESQENPACPTIACPVGNPSFNCSADPDCGNSGFATLNGKKICSSTRYA